jgi:hypothetical protein
MKSEALQSPNNIWIGSPNAAKNTTWNSPIATYLVRDMAGSISLHLTRLSLSLSAERCVRGMVQQQAAAIYSRQRRFTKQNI